MQKIKKKIEAIAAVIYAAITYSFTSYAITIGGNAKVNDKRFISMSLTEVPSMIINTVFWVLRIVGVVVLIGGIYRLTTARSNGDADEINAAMIKCTVGGLFLCMPAIMKALNLVV